MVIPEPTARSAVPGVSPGRGRKPVTNRALGKLKVVHGRRVVMLTDLKNMADYQNVENMFHANVLFFALKRLTVLRQQLSYQIPKFMEQLKRYIDKEKRRKSLERPG